MTLHELIEKTLAKSSEPDPYVIARRLLARLPADLRDELLLHGLHDQVKTYLRRDRREQRELPNRPGPSKWAQVQHVFVPGVGWKFDVDLTVDDLLVVADDYAARAESMAAREREYRTLAEELRRTGASTVGEYRARLEQAA